MLSSAGCLCSSSSNLVMWKTWRNILSETWWATGTNSRWINSRSREVRSCCHASHCPTKLHHEDYIQQPHSLSRRHKGPRRRRNSYRTTLSHNSLNKTRSSNLLNTYSSHGGDAKLPRARRRRWFAQRRRRNFKPGYRVLGHVVLHGMGRVPR